jgi:hypothetical protein
LNKAHVNILALLLTLIALGVFFYKALWLDFPLLPHTTSNSWIVESHITFNAHNEPVKVTAYAPKTAEQISILDEYFISRGYGLSTKTKDGNRQIQWTLRKASGPQSLYYRAVLRRSPGMTSEIKAKEPIIEGQELSGAKLEAAKALIAEVQAKSADTESFIAGVIRSISTPRPEGNVSLLLQKSFTNLKRAQVVVRVLQVAKIPARIVHGVTLSEATQAAPIDYRVEAYYDGSWKSFGLFTADKEVPEDYLPWWRGDEKLVTVEGGTQVVSTISLERYQEEGIVGAVEAGRLLNPMLLDFSLFALPIETQQVYHIVLLIPVGAFLVVLLRNVIGLKTFGTFLPVLVALAFRETRLFWGVLIFTLLIALGLAVRFYLDRLKLLLVPRLAAVLTVVVIIMSLVSIMTHKLGIEGGLSVALFPMVIITMTIERMSIVWDELGAWDAIRQGVVSLIAAAIIYGVISIEAIRHLVFVFPEILLVLLAVMILLGRYTGYRLLELFRFKAMAN